MHEAHRASCPGLVLPRFGVSWAEARPSIERACGIAMHACWTHMALDSRDRSLLRALANCLGSGLNRVLCYGLTRVDSLMYSISTECKYVPTCGLSIHHGLLQSLISCGQCKWSYCFICFRFLCKRAVHTQLINNQLIDHVLNYSIAASNHIPSLLST